MKDSVADVLNLLKGGDLPALALDESHRVIFCNSGAERLLGRPGAQIMGRKCHDLLSGRDTFGNRFCYADCAVSHAARSGASIHPFEIEVEGEPGGRRLVSVTTLRFAGRDTGEATIVHLLQPINERERYARLVAHLEGAASRVPPAPALPFSRAARPPMDGDADSELTGREREVLGCVAAGLQNKEIARALGISVPTARNHVHRILEKLGVHSKLEALSLCMNKGWVDALPRPRLHAVSSSSSQPA
jgi:DNA-binding CsgD family transcriptional regulator